MTNYQKYSALFTVLNEMSDTLRERNVFSINKCGACLG